MAVLPANYYLREHNAEVYVQEQIHKKLRFLNELDMQDNVTGEFTQYITTAEADEVTGDPITLAEVLNSTKSNSVNHQPKEEPPFLKVSNLP